MAACDVSDKYILGAMAPTMMLPLSDTANNVENACPGNVPRSVIVSYVTAAERFSQKAPDSSDNAVARTVRRIMLDRFMGV